MSRRILVIGASGFIGHACARHLTSLGHDVLGVGRTLEASALACYEAHSLDASDLQATVAKFQPDFCFNAAGAGDPAGSVQNPSRDFDANVVLVQRTLEALRLQAPECRYIGFSSAAAYGDNPELPWSEEAVPAPRSPYGYHKRCSELLLEQYYRIYGIRGLMVRAFSVYGPGLRKQLFWDLFQRSRHSTELALFGTGHETRDFLYIDDLTSGMVQLMKRASFDGEVLNLGFGQPTTIADACACFLRELGWEGRHYFTGTGIPGSPKRMEANMMRTFALGFVPRIALPEGMRRTAAWLRTHNE